MSKLNWKSIIKKKLKSLLIPVSWGFFAIVLLVSILYTAPSLSQSSFLDGATPIETATLVTDFTLTFLLVMIYTSISKAEKVQADESEQQREILETQKDTQKEQQKLFKANHQPLIREVYWHPLTLDGKPGIDIECVNKGNGPAKDLSLKCEISVPNSKQEKSVLFYKSMSQAEESLANITPRHSPLVEGPIKYSRGADGAVLSEDEGTSSFYSALEFSKTISKPDSVTIEQPMTYEDVLEILKEEGYESHLLNFSLHYENILGETESYTFFECWGDTESDLTSIVQEAKDELGTRELT